MQGWIKVHRELLEKPIWLDSTPEQKTILITLLMMANHKQKEWEWKGENFKAEPGQFVTSLPSITKKCGKGITIQNVRTALNRFKKYGFLTDESTNRNRLITIVNWGIYQAKENEDNNETNRQLTGNQQAANRQLTPNKNDKNVKNDKEDVAAGNPFAFYQENGFGMLTPFLRDEMNHWIDGNYFEESEQIIIEAMKEALRANAKTWNYVNKVLMSWSDKGIKTVADVNAHLLAARQKNVVHMNKQKQQGFYPTLEQRQKAWDEAEKQIDELKARIRERQRLANGG